MAYLWLISGELRPHDFALYESGLLRHKRFLRRIRSHHHDHGKPSRNPPPCLQSRTHVSCHSTLSVPQAFQATCLRCILDPAVLIHPFQHREPGIRATAVLHDVTKFDREKIILVQRLAIHFRGRQVATKVRAFQHAGQAYLHDEQLGFAVHC